MKKRIANLVLGVVVLLLAVQPKLLVHFCGENFIAFYLNQDPTTIQSACLASSKLNSSNSLASHSCPFQQKSTENPDQKSLTEGDNEQQTREDLKKGICPMRQLLVVDVDLDDFTPSQLSAYSFSLEWQTVTLFIPAVAHYWLPQQDVAHLLYGKAPPHSPLPLTGRDILLRHATFLI